MSTASSGLRVRVVTGLRLPQASLGVPPASRRVMAYLRTYGSWRSPRAISDRNVYGTVPATARRHFRRIRPAWAFSSGCGSALSSLYRVRVRVPGSRVFRVLTENDRFYLLGGTTRRPPDTDM